jgi:hypothetical protein
MTVMWETPVRDDFVVERGILAGIGKLSPNTFLRVQALALPLLARSMHPQFINPQNLLPNIIPDLRSTLERFLHRLQNISMDYRTMQVSVSETQGVFLELVACLDYIEFFKPSIVGEPVELPKDVRMGAFTNDPLVCEWLYRAKLPAWLVRPHTTLKTIRIKNLVNVLQPRRYTSLDVAYVGKINHSTN